MKIRKFFEIEDGVYIAILKTEDWSENDSNLILRFGEPEIDVGGKITVYTEITGVHDGGDASVVLVDSTKTWTTNVLAGRIVRHTSSTTEASVVSNTEHEVVTLPEISWNDGDAYSILEVAFTLSTDYRRIKTESPFVHKFDSRDYTVISLEDYTVPESLRPTAKVMSLAWSDNIEQRLISAITTLRTNTDDYTGEEVTTV